MKEKPKLIKFTKELCRLVETMLKEDYSPEQNLNDKRSNRETKINPHIATHRHNRQWKSGHKDIATALGIDVYFAPPYHSRGRGANETGASEPIPPDRNLSRCRNDKSHLDFFASDPEHEVYKPVKTSLKNKKSGAYEIFLGTEIVKDPGLLECKHRGFQIQQMFRSMIELDFGKVEDCKCIIRHLLAGCGQYSKILSPIS